MIVALSISVTRSPRRRGEPGQFGLDVVDAGLEPRACCTRPSPLVTVVRTTPVLVLVAVTVTPGSTASPWSRTRPLNVLVACAEANPLVASTTHATSHIPWHIRRLNSLIRLSSLVTLTRLGT